MGERVRNAGTTAAALVRPRGSPSGWGLLLGACLAASIAVVWLAGPLGVGETWGDVTSYVQFATDAARTRSLAGVPYPWLSLAPMAVAALGGPLAWALLSCASVSVVAVLLAAASWSRGRAPTVAYWWLACCVALGPVTLTRLEAPLSVLLVVALLAPSPTVRAVVLGAAVWVKAWPVLLSPAALRASRPAWVTFGATLVGLLALGSVLFDGVTAWLTAQSGRSLQVESLPATVPMLLSAVSPAYSTVFQAGLEKAWTVEGPLTDVIATVSTALVGATLLAGVGLCWRVRVWSTVRVEDATVALVTASFCLAPVFSPQYLLALAAIVAALSVTRDSIPGGWLLLAACAVTQAIFPTGYGALLGAEPRALTLLLLRQALLLAVAAVWTRRVWGADHTPSGRPRATTA